MVIPHARCSPGEGPIRRPTRGQAKGVRAFSTSLFKNFVHIVNSYVSTLFSFLETVYIFHTMHCTLTLLCSYTSFYVYSPCMGYS